MKVVTYLYFKDNAIDTIDLYQSIFGAEVICEYLFEEGMTQKQELLGKTNLESGGILCRRC